MEEDAIERVSSSSAEVSIASMESGSDVGAATSTGSDVGASILDTTPESAVSAATG